MPGTTCLAGCPVLGSPDACLGQTGCVWLDGNATSAGAGGGLGSCLSADQASSSMSGIAVGAFLSLIGDIAINIGMNTMKYSHNTNDQREADGLERINFYLMKTWWVGVILMVIGELGNLAAYGFAPAAIVTPMGAVGVVCNLFITTMILKEKCNAVNIAGIVCVISGIVLIVVFAPRTNIDITSDSVVQQYILTNQMGFYLIMWTTLFVMMLPLCKRFGEKSVAIYVATGSVVASLTIVSAKVFSSLVTRGVTKGFDKDWISPVPYLALLFLVTTAVGSMHFINMAMMKFGNSQVIPVYYAMFTTASVGSVGFVFREFSCMNTVGQAVVFAIGIILAVAGVCLVQFQFKDAAEGEEEDVGKNGNANEEDEEGSRCDGPQNPAGPELEEETDGSGGGIGNGSKSGKEGQGGVKKKRLNLMDHPIFTGLLGVNMWGSMGGIIRMGTETPNAVDLSPGHEAEDMGGTGRQHPVTPAHVQTPTDSLTPHGLGHLTPHSEGTGTGSPKVWYGSPLTALTPLQSGSPNRGLGSPLSGLIPLQSRAPPATPASGTRRDPGVTPASGTRRDPGVTPASGTRRDPGVLSGMLQTLGRTGSGHRVIEAVSSSYRAIKATIAERRSMPWHAQSARFNLVREEDELSSGSGLTREWGEGDVREDPNRIVERLKCAKCDELAFGNIASSGLLDLESGMPRAAGPYLDSLPEGESRTGANSDSEKRLCTKCCEELGLISRASGSIAEIADGVGHEVDQGLGWLKRTSGLPPALLNTLNQNQSEEDPEAGARWPLDDDSPFDRDDMHVGIGTSLSQRESDTVDEAGCFNSTTDGILAMSEEDEMEGGDGHAMVRVSSVMGAAGGEWGEEQDERGRDPSPTFSTPPPVAMSLASLLRGRNGSFSAAGDRIGSPTLSSPSLALREILELRSITSAAVSAASNPMAFDQEAYRKRLSGERRPPSSGSSFNSNWRVPSPPDSSDSSDTTVSPSLSSRYSLQSGRSGGLTGILGVSAQLVGGNSALLLSGGFGSSSTDQDRDEGQTSRPLSNSGQQMDAESPLASEEIRS